MTRTKYQVFVSSTYEDLKQERNEIVKAILSMGHIPVGMEMFNAADDAQWEIIKRQIDQSDYYTVLVAHRYGSILRNLSYTEREYNYAVEQGIPVMGFVIENKASWPSDLMETDDKVRAKLAKFKAKVKKKPVNFWSNSLELSREFTAAFATIINTNPRPGWVRGTEVSGPDVTNELGRLSKENSVLRAENDQFKSTDAVKARQEMKWVNTKFDVECFITHVGYPRDTGTVELYWYELLNRLFSSHQENFHGRDVLTALENIFSDRISEARNSDGGSAIEKCSLMSSVLVSVAEQLMAHSIVHPVPLKDAKNCVWQLTENAASYSDLVAQMMARIGPSASQI